METIRKGRFTLKQIFLENWDTFLLLYRALININVAFNIWKIINCREPEGLGYVTYACPDHPTEICHIPRSCKSRFCSVCAKTQIDKWVADMDHMFPNCSYFHITFTVPSQFRTLLFKKRSLLNAVFSAAAETLISFCQEKGFQPAITAVLHTFGSNMKRHIHIHFIVSAGGLKLDGKAERFVRYKARKQKDPRAKKRKVSIILDNPAWIPWSTFPYKMLQKRYQAIIIEHLKSWILKDIGSANPDPELRVFSVPSVMRAFFDDLKKQYKNGFFVHTSKERQSLKQTVRYIGRYARRPPMSEVRINDYTGDWVTFTYKDYRNNGGKVRHTIKTHDFIKRLIQHIPPHYFNVIRHYGISASRVKNVYKNITDKLLGKLPKTSTAMTWRERQTQFRGQDPLLCRICKKVMHFVSSHIPNPLSMVKTKLIAVMS